MRVASLIASLRERERGRERVAARRKPIPTSSIIINLLLHRQPLHEEGRTCFRAKSNAQKSLFAVGRTPRPTPGPELSVVISCILLQNKAISSHLLIGLIGEKRRRMFIRDAVDILTGEVVLYCTYYLPGFRHAFFSVLTFSSPQTKSINLSSSPFQDGARHIYFGG